MTMLPAELTKPIIKEAASARKAQSTYTCSVVVERTTGSSLSLRKSKKLQVETWDIGPIIDGIEGHGWSLMTINHVFVPSTGGSSGAFGNSSSEYSGEVRAYLVFRLK
ncbi:hypothetical protein [Brevibacterium moorei]|jgi:hypothetical protein|uniref:hypothetical protein n=1 Tax=Brevibacterium moorei TaxID=2968457 RepID=UPI00211CE28B|nr:hypothetical protein [Brevibacterium sp. 68QC2CO]MCQ9386416.1 hypothetical protein [Brevibacterium sp. 68QC2CO]